MDSCNINTESSTSCKRCFKRAPNGLKCVNCGRVSHPSCLKNFKTIQYMENNLINCCEETLLSENGVHDVEHFTDAIENIQDVDKIKIKFLEEIIKQKDQIILNQNIAIKALSDQIQLIKTFEQNRPTLTAKPSTKLETAGAEPVGKKNDCEIAIPQLPSIRTESVQGPSTSRKIRRAEAKTMCEIINLNNYDDTVVPPKEESRKSKRRDGIRSILIGNSSNLIDCPLRAASATQVKNHFYHVSNLETGTDETVLCDYLCKFAPSCKVEKLSSRHPERYDSFKVTVLKDEADRILDKQIWPEGVVLNRFFPARRRND